MSKSDCLKKLYTKLTGKESKGESVCELLDEMVMDEELGKGLLENTETVEIKLTRNSETDYEIVKMTGTNVESYDWLRMSDESFTFEEIVNSVMVMDNRFEAVLGKYWAPTVLFNTSDYTKIFGAGFFSGNIVWIENDIDVSGNKIPKGVYFTKNSDTVSSLTITKKNVVRNQIPERCLPKHLQFGENEVRKCIPVYIPGDTIRSYSLKVDAETGEVYIPISLYEAIDLKSGMTMYLRFKTDDGYTFDNKVVVSADNCVHFVATKEDGSTTELTISSTSTQYRLKEKDTTVIVKGNRYELVMELWETKVVPIDREYLPKHLQFGTKDGTGIVGVGEAISTVDDFHMLSTMGIGTVPYIRFTDYVPTIEQLEQSHGTFIDYSGNVENFTTVTSFAYLGDDIVECKAVGTETDSAQSGMIFYLAKKDNATHTYNSSPDSPFTFPKAGLYTKYYADVEGYEDYAGTAIIESIVIPDIITPIPTEYLPKAEAVADVTEAPTAEQFNALLASLRNVGYLAE